jgi:hypothetical protein
MLVYDIVNRDDEAQIQKYLDRLIAEGHLKKLSVPALFEEFKVVPRGKANNRVFVVVNTETGAELGTHKIRGLADAEAKDANAKAKEKADKDAKDKAKADKDANKPKRTLLRKLELASHGIRGLLSIVGIVYQVDEQIKYQGQMYDQYLAGNFGAVGSEEAIERYKKESKAAYGVWVAQTAAIVVNSLATAAIAKKVLSLIRSLVTLGLLSTTGVIGAIVAFLVGESLSYAILWFLAKPSTIETLMNAMWDVPGMTSTMAGLAEITNPIVPGVKENLRQALSMDPRADAERQSGADKFKSGAPAPAPATAPAPARPAGSPDRPASAPQRQAPAPASNTLDDHPLLKLN